MRGISEERLRKLIENDDYYDSGIEKSVIYGLIANECHELNPWLPIDENTPKDRKLLMFIPGHGKEVMRHSEIKMWSPNPTHYQELPDDPEPGDKNG